MKNTFGPRGFVTIATGQERYYKLAANLLLSYRRFAAEPLPFAIIADRENAYTAAFDHVIIISDPENSYNDKLKLFRELPYDETIFIDADSLAYGDLNVWWDMFADCGDFSLFGYAWRDLVCGRGWFVPSGMGEFAEKIHFIPDFNGGVYYMRNTPVCEEVFRIASHCAAHYADYRFNGFSTPADEPVLALGMAVCGLEPLNQDGELIFAPRRKQLRADISVPRAEFRTSGGKVFPRVRLIHFSNYRTQLAFYRNEVAKLTNGAGGCTQNCINCTIANAARYSLYRLCDIVPFSKRVLRKIKRMLKRC